MVARDVADWPGLAEEPRRQAQADGIGPVLAEPLVATSGPAGALIIVREAGASPFMDDERQLARTIGEAMSAVIEIDRLYRRATRQAAEEERQALARDLHDAVTQSIYSATLIAEALPAVWARDPAEGQRSLESLRRLVRAALAEMRNLLFELRPSALASAPLDSLLERLGDALGGQTQAEVTVQVEPRPRAAGRRQDRLLPGDPGGLQQHREARARHASERPPRHRGRRRAAHRRGRRARVRPAGGLRRPDGSPHHGRASAGRRRHARRAERRRERARPSRPSWASTASDGHSPERIGA